MRLGLERCLMNVRFWREGRRRCLSALLSCYRGVEWGPERFAILPGKDNKLGFESCAGTSHSLVTHTPVGKKERAILPA